MSCETTHTDKNATWPTRKGRTRSVGHASSSGGGGCCVTAGGRWSIADGEGEMKGDFDFNLFEGRTATPVPGFVPAGAAACRS